MYEETFTRKEELGKVEDKMNECYETLSRPSWKKLGIISPPQLLNVKKLTKLIETERKFPIQAMHAKWKSEEVERIKGGMEKEEKEAVEIMRTPNLKKLLQAAITPCINLEKIIAMQEGGQIQVEQKMEVLK